MFGSPAQHFISMTTTSLKLISSMATRELLAELCNLYAREHGQTIECIAVGGVDAATRIQADEHFDLVVLASNAIDKLSEDHKLQSPRVDLVKSGVAIAVREGAPRPDISNQQAVKQAVMNAKSLSYSTGPSGVYLEKLFERWGILADIKSKIVVPPPGVPVGSLVAKGDSELGFQQLSELMSLAGISVLGPLPDSIQTITTFSGAVAATSTDKEAALKVLQFMRSPATAAIKQRFGMEPA
jgi:molybdate transport system substrate-binding protein